MRRNKKLDPIPFHVFFHSAYVSFSSHRVHLIYILLSKSRTLSYVEFRLKSKQKRFGSSSVIVWIIADKLEYCTKLYRWSHVWNSWWNYSAKINGWHRLCFWYIMRFNYCRTIEIKERINVARFIGPWTFYFWIHLISWAESARSINRVIIPKTILISSVIFSLPFLFTNTAVNTIRIKDALTKIIDPPRIIFTLTTNQSSWYFLISKI